MLKALSILFLGILPVFAQLRPVVDTTVAAPNATSTLPDHPIVPNDLLLVTVTGESELSRSARVGSDGTIVMPKLAKNVKVQGMLPREVEAEIAKELVAEQLLVHPVVVVSLQDYAQRLISVVGDVKIPGQFPISTPITLMEALAKAGWTTPDAGSELIFTKSPSDAPRKIDILRLQKTADPDINVVLTGGEVVNVPDALKVWVTGNVLKPQAVPIRAPGDATVLKVIASAEGLTQYYGKIAYIYRPDAKGVRREIPVELFKIVHHKEQDVPLLADDILLIPDDNGTKRRVLITMLEGMAGAGATSAVLYGLR
jgi:polysaccharide export outer membrane protein